MSNADKTNHWKDLADELGTQFKPPDEGSPKAAQSSVPGVSSVQSSKPTGPQRKKGPKKAAARARSNWNNLQQELGIEPEVSAAEEGSGGSVEISLRETAEEQSFVVAELAAEPQAEAEAGTTSTAEDAESRIEGTPPRRRRRRRRRTAESSSKPSAPAEDLAEPAVEQVEVSTAAEADVQSKPASTEEEDAPAKRHRRRRRRGRKSEDDSPAPEAEAAPEPYEATSDSGASDDWLGEDQAAEMATDDLDVRDEESVADESESTESGSRGQKSGETKASHRSIPTWQETIGSVITANMESRGKSAPTKKAAPSGRGSRRGRGRRRGKSSNS